MSTNAAQSLISSAQIYKPEIYQAAEKGSSCEDEKIGTASTNVVAQILMEKVILLLPGTPALAQQVEKKKIDEDTAKKVAYYNDYGKFNCVTLKGDKYNPMGTLEGGFNKQSGLLKTVHQY